MREIKYRLWHLEDKKYYIVYCLQFCDEFNEPLNYEAAQIRRNDQWEWIEKDKYILEESTGKIDIEEQELFEGDKVEYYVRKRRREGVIAWGTVGFWIVGQTDRLRWIEHWKIKKIGTIHDNPE